MNRRDWMLGTVGGALGLLIGGTVGENAIAQLTEGDAEKKKYLIEECGMKFDHLGIPTTEDMKWDTYLENLKIHIMEYENDPFGIEWMKFEKECPLPEIIQTRPHVAFVVKDIEKAMKGFKQIVPVGNPREGMKTVFIQHKGIAVEFIERSGK